MKAWCLVVIGLFGLAAGPPPARPPRPAPNVLRRPGETTVFAFVTRSGKTVSLCEGPSGTYLVYRFGTAAKVELQYPAVLDASSWKKFTYWADARGGGVKNAGRETSQLSFRIGATEYTLSDEMNAVYNRKHEEVYQRSVDVLVDVKGTGKLVVISGKVASAIGGLLLNDAQYHKVTLDRSIFPE